MARRFHFDKPTERIERLHPSEVRELLADLLLAFQIVRDHEEVALFVQDLLTKDEVKRLAKRLRIAMLLLEGMTYEEIETELHTSHGTVAKVASWLKEKGDGFRQVIKKISKKRNLEAEVLASKGISLKKRIQRYTSLAPLVEQNIKKSEEKEARKLQQVLESLNEKDKLFKSIDKILKDYYQERKRVV